MWRGGIAEMAERPSLLGLNRPNLKLNCPPLPDLETSPQLAYLRSHSTGKLKFSPNHIYDFTCADLVDEGEIGRGNFGTVNRMLHPKSGCVLAVKRIRSNTVNQTEQKHLLMELEAIMNSQCENIVQFYGAIFREGDCWICMEMMDLSLEKLYKIVYEKQRRQLPEEIIGYIAVSTVNALSYLKEHLKIIHRDIKPSNILLDHRGYIKLCDFGIAGHLIDSIAKTQDAGCRPYMAPERLQSNDPYDVRSDVWSLGITLFEISTGRFPFSAWDSPFQQLQEVVNGEPPVMQPGSYSAHLVTFVNHCLIKGKEERPKYKDLMSMEFYKTYNVVGEEVARARSVVGDFVSSALVTDCQEGSPLDGSGDEVMNCDEACTIQTPRSNWVQFS
uniref:mitogen-activated protein kinase kinase n=2 Tax=Parascaris univalens TaxID=6257 RepID=A0A915C9C8_PARUN